jgi:serine/threonine-protein kinase 24/25/MST4
VVEDDVPLPPKGQYTEELRDFLRQCLQKDPYKRPPAETLLQHPFITRHSADPASLRDFMQARLLPAVCMCALWNARY